MEKINDWSNRLKNAMPAILLSFYGALLWRNNGASLRQGCVAWRKALKRVWRLSPRTHCNTIYLLAECEPMEIIIQRIFINFVNSIQNNVVLSQCCEEQSFFYIWE